MSKERGREFLNRGDRIRCTPLPQDPSSPITAPPPFTPFPTHLLSLLPYRPTPQGRRGPAVRLQCSWLLWQHLQNGCWRSTVLAISSHFTEAVSAAIKPSPTKPNPGKDWAVIPTYGYFYYMAEIPFWQLEMSLPTPNHFLTSRWVFIPAQTPASSCGTAEVLQCRRFADCKLCIVSRPPLGTAIPSVRSRCKCNRLTMPIGQGETAARLLACLSITSNREMMFPYW